MTVCKDLLTIHVLEAESNLKSAVKLIDRGFQIDCDISRVRLWLSRIADFLVDGDTSPIVANVPKEMDVVAGILHECRMSH